MDSLLAVNFHGLRRLLLLRSICGLGLLLSCGDEVLSCGCNMRMNGSSMVCWGVVVSLSSDMGRDWVVCWGGVVHWGGMVHWGGVVYRGGMDWSLVMGRGGWVSWRMRSIMLHWVGNKMLNLGL